MPKLEIMPQRISDAKKFYVILNNPNFKYFTVKPKSVNEEIKFLKGNAEKRRKNIAHNYTIVYGNEIVGGIGIKIDQHRKHLGELGYFLDEKHWDKGIMTKAVKIVEKIGFTKLKIKRMEILMLLKNIGSRKVAIKSGYKKEGIAKKKLPHNGKFLDCYVYAKTKP